MSTSGCSLALICNPPVKILDIDEESLRTFGQWPWPRDFLARLLNRLTEAGVAAIALDMLQQEPDRTGPESLLKQWQGRSDFTSLQEAIKQLPNPDAEYIQALGQDPAVLSFAVNATIGGTRTQLQGAASPILALPATIRAAIC